jgi:chromate transporter
MNRLDEGRPLSPVPLATIAWQWTRLGVIGFGGPPTHIALLRQLCVEDRRWMSPEEFEDAIAATNLLPGPASTQLAIYCAWRLRGVIGGTIGGLGFILPGLLLILVLSAVFLAERPPMWVSGAAAGAGAVVPAVAVSAALALAPASWRRSESGRGARVRWLTFLAFGAAAAATLGPYLVLVLLVCGLFEVWIRARPGPRFGAAVPLLPGLASLTGLGALVWVAFKVGALSYGGGFVIIPLMQADAVSHYKWMTEAQFLTAVALGQITPGPVVLTVAVVGYAAAGVAGGLLAAGVAFAPSFLFVFVGGRHFGALRANRPVQAFLAGAGAASIGAIAGSSIPLALSLTYLWQFAVLAAAAIWLAVRRRGVVTVLLAAALAGVVVALSGTAVGR